MTSVPKCFDICCADRNWPAMIPVLGRETMMGSILFRNGIASIRLAGLATLLVVAMALPVHAQPSSVLDHVMAIQDAHTPSLMSSADVLGTATGLGPNDEPAVIRHDIRPEVFRYLLRGSELARNDSGPWQGDDDGFNFIPKRNCEYSACGTRHAARGRDGTSRPRPAELRTRPRDGDSGCTHPEPHVQC